MTIEVRRARSGNTSYYHEILSTDSTADLNSWFEDNCDPDVAPASGDRVNDSGGGVWELHWSSPDPASYTFTAGNVLVIGVGLGGDGIYHVYPLTNPYLDFVAFQFDF